MERDKRQLGGDEKDLKPPDTCFCSQTDWIQFWVALGYFPQVGWHIFQHSKAIAFAWNLIVSLLMGLKISTG